MSYSLVSVIVFFLLLMNLCQFFCHKISVRSNGFIERLLFFQFGFSLNILFLKFCNEIIPELDLIPRIKVFCFSWSGLERVRISLLFKHNNFPIKLFNFFLLSKKFIFLLFYELFLAENVFKHLFVAGLRTLKLFFIHISVSLQFFNERTILSLTFLLII